VTERSTKLKIPPRLAILRNPLVSERLELSPVTTRDAEAFFEAVDESRAALQPWLPWVHLNNSHEDSLRYAQACERDWDQGHAARFFIKTRESKRLVGVLSFENCSITHRSCYLGYWLHIGEWGRGLMTEAARRGLRFAFEEMNVHRVACAAGTKNSRSLRVIERLGFQYEGTARQAEWVDHRWISHSVYALLASDRASNRLDLKAE
jgi:ribosomal-protein-serine acetyltransferase